MSKKVVQDDNTFVYVLLHSYFQVKILNVLLHVFLKMLLQQLVIFSNVLEKTIFQVKYHNPNISVKYSLHQQLLKKQP